MQKATNLHQTLMIGKRSSMAVFITGIFYAVITAIGLVSLPSKNAVIADPYFTLMELLTILISILMLISITAIHNSTPTALKTSSLLALVFMALMTGITCAVHFVILAIANDSAIQQVAGVKQMLSFQWPSLAYAIDILAWDIFFPLSIAFLVPVFSQERKYQALRWILIIAALLSFLGLSGVVLNNMQVRNIGIIGYAVLGPIAFLLISKWFGKIEPGIDHHNI